MKENMDALLRLKGTQEEREWLLENLETLSVRDGTILAAALEWRPPDSMSDVVNHVLSLEEYEVRYQAGNYEQLGAFRLREDGIPKELWQGHFKGGIVLPDSIEQIEQFCVNTSCFITARSTRMLIRLRKNER